MRRTTRTRSVGLAALAIAATCVVGATAAGTAGPTFKPAGQWGTTGSGHGQVRANAYGLATDKAGNVYVADTDNFRIQVFSATGAFRRSHPFGADVSVQDVATGPGGSVWGTALQSGEARSFGGGGATISVSSGGGARGIAVDENGKIYVSSSISNVHQVTRFDGAGAKEKAFGGFADPRDVETSPDGSFYVVDGLTVKRFVNDRIAKVFKGGASKPIGIAVDLDCNLWMTNISQRNLTKVSPSGKVLGAATSGDLIAQDVAVGPKGDLYAYDSGSHSIVRFTEDKTKPATASVGGSVSVTKGVAKVKYTLSGVACPAQLAATASLSGAVKGKASVKVAAGKSTVLSIPARGSSGKAQFKIVLKTNGRPTTQVASVNVTAR